MDTEAHVRYAGMEGLKRTNKSDRIFFISFSPTTKAKEQYINIITNRDNPNGVSDETIEKTCSCCKCLKVTIEFPFEFFFFLLTVEKW